MKKKTQAELMKETLQKIETTQKETEIAEVTEATAEAEKTTGTEVLTEESSVETMSIPAPNMAMNTYEKMLLLEHDLGLARMEVTTLTQKIEKIESDNLILEEDLKEKTEALDNIEETVKEKTVKAGFVDCLMNILNNSQLISERITFSIIDVANILNIEVNEFLELLQKKGFMVELFNNGQKIYVPAEPALFKYELLTIKHTIKENSKIGDCRVVIEAIPHITSEGLIYFLSRLGYSGEYEYKEYADIDGRDYYSMTVAKDNEMFDDDSNAK